MNIVFMGTPSYAAVILESLLKSHTIKALVCQPDKRAGRDMQLKMPATKELLLKSGLEVPILQPQALDLDFVDLLKQIQFDIIVVAAFGKILPKEILNLAPCVNLHTSILPKYRGASPIQESILANEKFFGVTLMKMEEGLDSGDILGMRIIKNHQQNSKELFGELSNAAAILTLQYLEKRDLIVPMQQIGADATYCKKIKKEMGIVDFSDAENLYRKALAYEGWPEIFLKNGLKIKEVVLNEIQSCNLAGEILEITEDKILVGCLQGSVWIGTLQAPSKKAMSAYQYLQGRRLRKGDILS
ncbi:methionyl-tRNA formyltransferase [Helicobacter pullorum]|uniref:Methionyl-tRNA formyltransferase n=1 Tax=Helicobacter pullorum TaxID=35818 RepID=A0A0N1ECF6_9HELI|nr:methionyl-tRNA formyltransferase [Helicobacter pullorum]KPH56126.1 methionyl-tRNA formyltransferase [Helicobacter pullorum]